MITYKLVRFDSGRKKRTVFIVDDKGLDIFKSFLKKSKIKIFFLKPAFDFGGRLFYVCLKEGKPDSSFSKENLYFLDGDDFRRIEDGFCNRNYCLTNVVGCNDLFSCSIFKNDVCNHDYVLRIRRRILQHEDFLSPNVFAFFKRFTLFFDFLPELQNWFRENKNSNFLDRNLHEILFKKFVRNKACPKCFLNQFEGDSRVGNTSGCICSSHVSPNLDRLACLTYNEDGPISPELLDAAYENVCKFISPEKQQQLLFSGSSLYVLLSDSKTGKIYYLNRLATRLHLEEFSWSEIKPFLWKVESPAFLKFLFLCYLTLLHNNREYFYFPNCIYRLRIDENAFYVFASKTDIMYPNSGMFRCGRRVLLREFAHGCFLGTFRQTLEFLAKDTIPVFPDIRKHLAGSRRLANIIKLFDKKSQRLLKQMSF